MESMVSFVYVSSLIYLTLLARTVYEKVAFEQRPKEIKK